MMNTESLRTAEAARNAHEEVKQLRARVESLERMLAAETKRADDNAAEYDRLRNGLNMALQAVLVDMRHRQAR